MSLVSLVLRNLTVLALIDKTLAGDEVRSSLLVPINEMQAEPRPMIAVFTDHVKADAGDIHGSDMLGAAGTVTLALEIACITKTAAQDQENVETLIPETDEGMEMTLDVIQRQALYTLQAGDSVWASLWRECRVKIRGLVIQRGASIEKGVRFAARRLEIQVQALNEPVPGAPLTPFWIKLLAAFDSDPRMSGLSVMLRNLIDGQPLPEWRQVQAELGMSDGIVDLIGLNPTALTGLDTPVAVTELAAADLNRDTVVTVDG